MGTIKSTCTYRNRCHLKYFFLLNVTFFIICMQDAKRNAASPVRATFILYLFLFHFLPHSSPLLTKCFQVHIVYYAFDVTCHFALSMLHSCISVDLAWMLTNTMAHVWAESLSALMCFRSAWKCNKQSAMLRANAQTISPQTLATSLTVQIIKVLLMKFMTVILHRHACVSHLHVVYRAVISFA